ncbi:unnamed protein product, partial [Sphacelaria rigidula]
MGRFFMMGMGDVSLVLGMEAVRDRNSKRVNTSHTNYNKSLQERYEIANGNPACTPGAGQALSLDQRRGKILNEEDKQRYQPITGSVMYLARVTRYDIGYGVNQLARATSKPSKAHVAAAKHLLRYSAGMTDHKITYNQGGFQLTAFSEANWGDNPDNGKS